jgi:heterodisulfide reductase subunit A
MNTIKSTLVLKTLPGHGGEVFYIDIRAFGKGFEELYARSRRLVCSYPRPADRWKKRPIRTARGGGKQRKLLEFHELDMLVLAQACSRPSTQRLQEMLGCS